MALMQNVTKGTFGITEWVNSIVLFGGVLLHFLHFCCQFWRNGITIKVSPFKEVTPGIETLGPSPGELLDGSCKLFLRDQFEMIEDRLLEFSNVPVLDSSQELLEGGVKEKIVRS